MVVDYVFIYVSFCFKKLNVKESSDIDDLVMGMASQIAEREDSIVVEDLRGFKSSSSLCAIIYLGICK